MKRYNFTILEKIGTTTKLRVNTVEIERHKVRTHPQVNGPIGEALDLLITYGGDNIKVETDSFIFVIQEA